MTSRTNGERARSTTSNKLERTCRPEHEDARARTVSAEGRDGALRFVLRRVAGGLYVEREEHPRKGTRTIVSVEFADRGEFERWCDDDPCRFQSPLLHQRLRRDADQLWEYDS